MYLDSLFKNAPHIDIKQLSCDSREKMSDCIYFCMKGVKYDGHNYIDEAIENGANVIVYSDEINTDKKAIFVKVNNVNDVLKTVSDIFYDYPAKKLETYVISGTNGRSSVSTIINTLLTKYKKCSSIGIFGINYGEINLLSNQPTLTLLDNQKQLSKFVSEGCQVCTLEASALSLSYNKLDIVYPDVFIYTSTLTDSREYKESRFSYNDSLKRYLYSLEDNTIVVLNKDDTVLFSDLQKASTSNLVTYGKTSDADYVIKNIKLSNKYSYFEIVHNNNIYKIKTHLLSQPNVYNLTAALVALDQKGYQINDLLSQIKNIECIDGVVDRLNFDDYNIIVDCAYSITNHTNILEYAKQVTLDENKVYALISINTTDSEQRLSSLINCVCKYADEIILTEDDTYEFDINEVMNKAANYITDKNYIIVEDREEAIESAIELLNKNDTLLLLGKGNEDFLYKGLVKKNYVGDKRLAYKYMNKRIREEKETINYHDTY